MRAETEDPTAIHAGKIHRLHALHTQLAIGRILVDLGQIHAHGHAAIPVGYFVGNLTIGQYIVVFPMVDVEQFAANVEQGVGVSSFRNHHVAIGIFDRIHIDIEQLGSGILHALNIADFVGVFEEYVVGQWIGFGGAVGVSESSDRLGVVGQHFLVSGRHWGGTEFNGFQLRSSNNSAVSTATGYGEANGDRYSGQREKCKHACFHEYDLQAVILWDGCAKPELYA